MRNLLSRTSSAITSTLDIVSSASSWSGAAVTEHHNAWTANKDVRDEERILQRAERQYAVAKGLKELRSKGFDPQEYRKEIELWK